MAVAADRDRLSTIEALAGRYAFRDPAAIRAYLAANPDLPPLLREVATVVPARFGAGTPLALELFTDHEGDGHQDLVALIRTALPWDEAQDRLDRLGEDWWYDASQGLNGRLLLDIEVG